MCAQSRAIITSSLLRMEIEVEQVSSLCYMISTRMCGEITRELAFLQIPTFMIFLNYFSHKLVKNAQVLNQMYDFLELLSRT